MRRVVAGCLLLLIAACSGTDTPGVTSGTLTLTLAGGTGTDGAVLMIVSGGPITAVDVPSGFQVATNADGAGTHVMVVGNLAAGAIATIHVPDMSRQSAYVAAVLQVSDRASFALLDPVRYQVTIGR